MTVSTSTTPDRTVCKEPVVAVVVAVIRLNHADGGVRVYKRRAVRPPPGVDVEVRGQRHGHRCAHRAVAVGRVVDDDDIADPVDCHLQLVADARRLDDHRLGDIERVRDAEQRLEGVALRAAGRATVAGLVAHQHGEVAQIGDGGGRDTGSRCRSR